MYDKTRENSRGSFKKIAVLLNFLLQYFQKRWHTEQIEIGDFDKMGMFRWI